MANTEVFRGPECTEGGVGEEIQLDPNRLTLIVYYSYRIF